MASGPLWLVSSFRFRARLSFSIPFTFSSPRGITPTFGYGAPHSSAGGTSTLLSNALLSAHYAVVRILTERRFPLRLFWLIGDLLRVPPRDSISPPGLRIALPYCAAAITLNLVVG
jgi:hypothetical protein